MRRNVLEHPIDHHENIPAQLLISPLHGWAEMRASPSSTKVLSTFCRRIPDLAGRVPESLHSTRERKSCRPVSLVFGKLPSPERSRPVSEWAVSVAPQADITHAKAVFGYAPGELLDWQGVLLARAATDGDGFRTELSHQAGTDTAGNFPAQVVEGTAADSAGLEAVRAAAFSDLAALGANINFRPTSV
jgi:hypothetical protein